MTLILSQNQNQVNIRPFQYRDLDQIERLSQQALSDVLIEPETGGFSLADQDIQKLRRWYGFLKF